MRSFLSSTPTTSSSYNNTPNNNHASYCPPVIKSRGLNLKSYEIDVDGPVQRVRATPVDLQRSDKPPAVFSSRSSFLTPSSDRNNSEVVKARAYISPFSSHLDQSDRPTLSTKVEATNVSDETLSSFLSTKNELPLIVKPLRKFTASPSSTSTSRRTTLIEPPAVPRIPDPTSSLPRNFHKPTILHSAAPVVIGSMVASDIPYIDDDLPSVPQKESTAKSTPEIPIGLHRREDSGYRSMENIRKFSSGSSATVPAVPYVPVAPTTSSFSTSAGPSYSTSRIAAVPGKSNYKEADDEDDDDLEGFDWGDEYLNSRERRRCSLVLRTQTTLRVKSIIDKLLNCSGRDQRRALFSLKQIFQDDQDLVHEFVQNQGLDCMIRLGRTADQNHQNYILRALGQLMLYVDGMNGIISHNGTIQWLYELLDSPFRLVVKTALKLLLVFIEYNDNNALLVLSAIQSVDKSKGQPDWSGLMKVLTEKDSPDAETLVYGMTVVNKALHGIPDRDTYYDSVDTLDTLGMENAIKQMSRSNNKELEEQCRLYERELKEEDERGDNDDDMVKMRSPNSFKDVSRRSSQGSHDSAITMGSEEEIMSRSPIQPSESPIQNPQILPKSPKTPNSTHEMPEDIETALEKLNRALQNRREAEKSRHEESRRKEAERLEDIERHRRQAEERRRREREEEETQRRIEEEERRRELEKRFSRNDNIATTSSTITNHYTPDATSPVGGGGDDKKSMMRRRHNDAKQRQMEHEQFSANRSMFNSTSDSTASPARVPSPSNGTSQWQKKQDLERDQATTSSNDFMSTSLNERRKNIPQPIKIENQENVSPKVGDDDLESPAPSSAAAAVVKAPPPSFPTIFSPTESKTMDFPEVEEPKVVEAAPPPPRAKIESDTNSGGGGFAEMLQKRAARAAESNRGTFEKKDSEAEIQWKKAAENLKSRPLIINDLDFSEFHAVEFEQDPLQLARMAKMNEMQASGGRMGVGGGVPPPPPPPSSIPLPPRMLGANGIPQAPPPPSGMIPPPPPPGSLNGIHGRRDVSPAASKGVLKLHWKPTTVESHSIPSLKQKGSFWNTVDGAVPRFDANKIVQLFETKKEKEATVKKVAETKTQTLSVLPLKRSQAINIGLTKLPPINVIPAAIMKFDSLVLNKDGIEKILKTMLPSSKEIEEIENKSAENPEMTLGNAEQFLLKLSQIPCLLERLKLWLFTLDYKNSEKDIAEPLMDLQLAMKEMEESRTFKVAMGMLLAIGNSLSGTEIKGFYLDYLTKASEVKDPVYKHTLTYHLAEYMVEHYAEGNDLYSEFGAVARTARVDYKELLDNLMRLEKECKSSWECLAVISKNDNSSMKQKINDYLSDVAQRIHQLKAIYTVTKNRWHSFLLYFGYSVDEIPNQNPNEVFKMVTEFALEYRTTRDKILQQRKRMAEKRERNKTRGKIWALEGTNGSSSNVDSGMGEAPLRRRNQSAAAAATAVAAAQSQNSQQRHDEMSRMLQSMTDDGSLRKRGVGSNGTNGNMNGVKAFGGSVKDLVDNDSPEDEILNGLVKAATLQTDPRDQRRRARQFNRKSLRRTRTLKMVDGQLETCNY